MFITIVLKSFVCKYTKKIIRFFLATNREYNNAEQYNVTI